ncbi:MAG: DUF6538 domain-containing protein, partial [Gluconobacter sp.]
MLKKIGKTYHFRRAVPRGLRDSLGQTEFSISLKTQNRRTARSRAVVIYAEIDRVLRSGGDVKSKVDDLARRLREGAISGEDFKKGLLTEFDAADQESREALLNYLNEITAASALHVNRDLAELASGWRFVHDWSRGQARTEANALERALRIVSQARPAVSEQPQDRVESLTLKEAIRAFYAGTEREYADKHSARHAQDVSFRLLSELLGNDRKIREVTGSISIDTIERLRGVPKYHGKNGKNWPLEDVIASYEGEGDYETISEKTVKNHVGCWSRLWNYHLKREAVDRNIWQGHDFDTKRTRLVVRDWSDENLDKLMGKKWTFRGISRSTFAHIVGIAAYSGMRLEEICRLRPTDIAEVDGVLCFRIREHT